MIPLTLGVPMYKSERFLPELFATLSAMDPKPAQIIFLDDASPDHSFETAMELSRDFGMAITVFRHERNRGIASTYNELARLADQPWVHILDADDHPVEPDFYAIVARHLQGQACAVVTSVASNSRALQLGNLVLGRIVPPRPPEWWPLLGSFATRSGILYRRDRLQQHAFHDPAYPGSDIIHLLELRRDSHIRFEHRAHVYYNVHADATSSQHRDYSRYAQALCDFPALVRWSHKADLAVRRFGQQLDRS